MRYFCANASSEVLNVSSCCDIVSICAALRDAPISLKR